MTYLVPLAIVVAGVVLLTVGIVVAGVVIPAMGQPLDPSSSSAPEPNKFRGLYQQKAASLDGPHQTR